MKNTFGGLVKTRKLWESGWAIRERKKNNNNNNKQKEPRENPDGKTIVNISKKKTKKKQPNKKREKKKIGKKVEREDWKPDLGRI